MSVTGEDTQGGAAGDSLGWSDYANYNSEVQEQPQQYDDMSSINDMMTSLFGSTEMGYGPTTQIGYGQYNAWAFPDPDEDFDPPEQARHSYIF